jgi:hypothetical protein
VEDAVFYLTGSVTGVRDHLDARRIGFMKTPNIGNILSSEWVWAADNGCYGSSYVGDERWLSWLDSFDDEQKERCLFATAPDVVGDAQETLKRSLPWLPKIRERGYESAFVAQDGITVGVVPWDDLDVLFIGGSTKWKLGSGVNTLIVEAHRRRKHVHVGRVNSKKRYLAFASMGVRSADGTFIAFGPDVLAPKLMDWIEWHKTRPTLDFSG